MPAWSILLRVVLGAALVLNGAMGAFAATGMQMRHHASPGSGQAIEDAASDAPCHQAKGDSHTSPAVDPTPEPFKHPGPDCCDSANCTCICVQSVQVPPLHAGVSPAHLNHGQSVRPLSLGHSSPALPHPTRPPIG